MQRYTVNILRFKILRTNRQFVFRTRWSVVVIRLLAQAEIKNGPENQNRLYNTYET